MKKILSILLAVVMLCACCACGGDTASTDSTVSEGAVSSDTVSASGQAKPSSNMANKYFDTDVWEAVPMISQQLIDAGYENSEACQRAKYMTLDPVEGKIGYYCTDIGGIWRTLDGGKSWEPCNVGYRSGGGAGAAIDPNNTQRAIMVGCNTSYNESNGLHLTTNAGAEWTPVFMADTHKSTFIGDIGTHIDSRIQVAYDPTTKDDKIGGSAVIYWNRENYTTHAQSASKNHPAIYKSVDGGQTWAELSGTSEYAGGYIVVNAKDGRVAVGNEKGAWVSSDGGASWTKVSDLAMNCLVGVHTAPDNLYALTNDGLYVSNDFGGTFTKVEGRTFSGTKKLTNLRVSPADPDYMIMMWEGTADYSYNTYYTHDGGKTWQSSKRDTTGIWIPMTSWYAMYWFSPVDKNYIIANEYRSEDGGENFFISTKGFNAICIGVQPRFNINNDKYFAISSQDYNGGFSTDYGKTWKYVNWSGQAWGGFTYGAYTLNDKVSFAIDQVGWQTDGEIVCTYDGGETVRRTGLVVKGERSCYGALGKDNIGFAGEYRTDDFGQTWTKMEGCTGVLEHDPKTGKLFGFYGADFSVVSSTDDGVTWETVGVVGSRANDICYNIETNDLYICADGIVQIMDLDDPKFVFKDAGFKLKGATDMVFDPENADIVYVVTNNIVRRESDSVMRSLDGGKTWTQLVRRAGDGRDNCPDGGRGLHINFCKSTREIFVSGLCLGMWKMKAAPSNSTN